MADGSRHTTTATSRRWLRADARTPAGFIHHPDDFPLEVRRPWPRRPRGGDAREEGIGLLFHYPEFIRPGRWVEVRIPLRGETQCFRGEVVMVRAREQGFEVGLWLAGRDEAARARIVEQICHIESYLSHRTGGPPAGRERRAREWVTRFAATFPTF